MLNDLKDNDLLLGTIIWSGGLSWGKAPDKSGLQRLALELGEVWYIMV